jgi:hypothetical protein
MGVIWQFISVSLMFDVLGTNILQLYRSMKVYLWCLACSRIRTAVNGSG